MAIQCGESQMQRTTADTSNQGGGIINCVVDMLTNELQLEHMYLPKQNLIFVKIDHNTVNNKALNFE